MADVVTVVTDERSKSETGGEGAAPLPDNISDLISLFGNSQKNEDIPKGLEYFFSNNSNRMIIKPTGCCCSCGKKKYVIKDRSSQRIYKVMGGAACQSNVLATVEDLRKKEILRFEKVSSNTLSVLYRGGRKLGEIRACKQDESLADTYLLFIVNGPDGQELVRIFSAFDDTDNCWVDSDVTSTIIQRRTPYEMGTFQHTSRGVYAHCCGTRSGHTRSGNFRCDFHDHFDPYLKCLVLAAAFWRMKEGFRRYSDSKGSEGWGDG